MSTSRVLHFQDHIDRRQRRFERTLALYGADEERALLLRLLWPAVRSVGGDRAAIVWVEEYGPGLGHTHAALDLVSHPPRRSFPVEQLRLAWSSGVPGLHDVPDKIFSGRSLDVGSYRSLCAVALGSDGLKAWFLIVDSQSPRARLSPEVIEDVMFLAGECSAILLHRDLAPTTSTVLAPEGGDRRFPAWPVLKDLEGHESDEVMGRRISCRFLVARVVRTIVDDELVCDDEVLLVQLDGVRRELGDQFAVDAERACWEAVLAAVEQNDHQALAGAVLAFGVQVEEMGHLSGARELFRSAHQLAVMVGAERHALDAARFAGRTCRRASDWQTALSWYAVARSLAVAYGDRAKESVVLDGVASVYKERGNLPKAREVLNEALVAARESGDRYALGSAYHNLMSVAFLSGSIDDAILMGWRAVGHYAREQDQVNALTALAGVFVAAGELEAAENAYTVVVRRVKKHLYRLYALSGFAHVAALRGERREYERRLAILDGAGFTDGPAVFRAEAWVERGRAYELLGDQKEARRCYQEALRVAEEHRIGQFLMQAEEALRGLDSQSGRVEAEQLPAVSPLEEMEEIREELVRMRGLWPAWAGV